MNRRNFLKRCSLLPFVGGLAAVAKAGASDKRSGTRLATKEEIEKFKAEYPAIWSVWYPDNILGTSSNSVNHTIEIKCWDKDEPDIYTFEDGVPIS